MNEAETQQVAKPDLVEKSEIGASRWHSLDGNTGKFETY